MDYELNFLHALFLTVVIETIVLLVLSKTLYKNDKIPLPLVILTGVVASMATLPYLWFIFPLFIKSKLWYKLLSEVTAVVIETLIIYGMLKISLKKSFVISLICNLTSYLIGLLASPS